MLKPINLIYLYRKPKMVSFFGRRLTPPKGYYFVIVENSGLLKASLAGVQYNKINRRDTVYLVKKDFIINWGVSDLPVILENREKSSRFGFHGSSSFEVVEPIKFFNKVSSPERFSGEDFKLTMWKPCWDMIVKKAYSQKEIRASETPQVVESLLEEANAEMFSDYGIKVKKISEQGTNQ